MGDARASYLEPERLEKVSRSGVRLQGVSGGKPVSEGHRGPRHGEFPSNRSSARISGLRARVICVHLRVPDRNRNKSRRKGWFQKGMGHDVTE